MEDKIRQYVNYQFRFDKREDLEELKAEIIANLIDRYQANIEAGKNSEEAYVAAIKSMGNFTDSPINDVPEEFSVKPSIPDILMMSGAILSIFGLVITLLSPVTGTLVTALSILLFSGSAYYLYSFSQYLRKEIMDIEKHNILLRKIFKYMKTSFIFWAVSLSYTMSALVMNYLSKIVFLDPMSINLETIGSFVLAYLILFIIALIIFMLIFKTIYDRLMNHYYILTGTTSLKGKIKEGYEFLYGEEYKMPRQSIMLSKKFIPIFGLILMLPILFVPYEHWEIYNNDSILKCEGVFLTQLLDLTGKIRLQLYIFPFVLLIINLILMILSLMKKRINQILLIITYYLWLLSVSFFTLISEIIEEKLVDGRLYLSEGPSVIAMFELIIFTIIMLIRLLKYFKRRNTKKVV